MNEIKGAKVLCNWQPSAYDKPTIRAEFPKLLRKYGLRQDHPFWSIRCPADHRRFVSGSDAEDWHQDNVGQTCLLALWSNVQPTEVRNARGEVLQAADGDVLLIENSKVEHRAPRLTQDCERWFVRFRISDEQYQTEGDEIFERNCIN